MDPVVTQLIIWVALTLITRALTPYPKKPDAGEMGEVPIAEDGAPVPVVFGTVVVTNPNVVWWGDVFTSEIKAERGKK